MQYNPTKNPKQYQYYQQVVAACDGTVPYRKFAFGGAIRGGKTYVTLAILVYLCERYPGSRWVVVRRDLPTLQKTTMESLSKMLNGSEDWKWRRSPSNAYVEHTSGSRISFMAESNDRDPDLQKFLGLECNGIFFEQLEELSEKLWDIGASRAGSWYLDPMPPAFVFTTFNPTQRWPKTRIYERSLDGLLPTDFYYLTALPSDNAFVTEDQWATWRQMDVRYQQQFIQGDWTDFDDGDPRWAYAFNEVQHVKPTLPFLPTFPIHLSFDFNRDPLTCVVIQQSPQVGRGSSFFHFIREFAEPVQIHELCARILTTYPASIMYVGGDVSGRKGDVGYEERHATHYKIIEKHLGRNFGGYRLSDHNLEHHDSRLLVNTALSMYPNLYFSREGCPRLIHEYRQARVDVNHVRPGHLKKDRIDNKLDLFDGSRYAVQAYLRGWVEKEMMVR